LKRNIIYWTIIAILAFFHIDSLLRVLSLNIPFYLMVILLGISCYFSYKKMAINISLFTSSWSILLFVLQLFLLIIPITQQNLLVHVITFFVFITTELVRGMLGRKLTDQLGEIIRLEEQYHQLNETFRVVREERHDFLKHVSSVHFMLENSQLEEARSYIDDMVGSYKQTNLSIKGERGAVAGILHTMYKKAETSGIEMVYDFDLPLSTLPLQDKEMVALIGNLLSNSIEASVDWQLQHEKQTQVTLQFYKRSGLFLLICKNPTLPIPTEILDGLFLTYGKTTKGEDHEGLGTKLIQDIVKQHLGFLDFTCKDGEFLIKIKIPAIH
jgi:two-component system, LytTR family, sensor histidine kinase NatK